MHSRRRAGQWYDTTRGERATAEGAQAGRALPIPFLSNQRDADALALHSVAPPKPPTSRSSSTVLSAPSFLPPPIPLRLLSTALSTLFIHEASSCSSAATPSAPSLPLLAPLPPLPTPSKSQPPTSSSHIPSPSSGLSVSSNPVPSQLHSIPSSGPVRTASSPFSGTAISSQTSGSSERGRRGWRRSERSGVRQR